MMTRLPYSWARAHRALMQTGAKGVALTVSERTPAWALAEIRRRHGALPVRQVSDEELDTLLAAAYAQTGDAADVVDAVANEIDLDRLMQDIPEIEDLLETSDDAPIIRMINALFTQAARDGASDIHIEPFETHSIVRYRVDGTLRDIVSPRRAL
ncbi:MAG TPA: type II secretion system protein GspE, partial [Burkholderiaceae bacterium]|nr:type II secretion system protein GspE [Burkholderiaceae bacterium]